MTHPMITDDETPIVCYRIHSTSYCKVFITLHTVSDPIWIEIGPDFRSTNSAYDLKWNVECRVLIGDPGSHVEQAFLIVPMSMYRRLYSFFSSSFPFAPHCSAKFLLLVATISFLPVFFQIRFLFRTEMFVGYVAVRSYDFFPPVFCTFRLCFHVREISALSSSCNNYCSTLSHSVLCKVFKGFSKMAGF